MKAFGKSKGGGRRSVAREMAPLVVILATAKRSHGAILLDLSTIGARLRGADLPQVGEELLMTVETVRAYGRVAWSDSGECGVAFHEPLQSQEVEAVLKVADTTFFNPELRASFDAWTRGSVR